MALSLPVCTYSVVQKYGQGNHVQPYGQTLTRPNHHRHTTTTTITTTTNENNRQTDKMTNQLTILTAQYHQQLPPPRLAQSIPPAPILLRPEVQTYLYEHLFNEENPQAWPLPPASYRKRVLKMVLGVLETGATTEDDV